MTLPRISIWSLFRDDAGENIARYRHKINRLQYPAGLLRFYLVEGDSQDNTLGELRAWAVEDQRVTVIQYHTGLPRMQHTPHPDRIRCLAETGNAALDALAADGWGDYAMLIESDLYYEPDIITRLLASKPKDAAVISPYIWLPGPNDHVQFYDIWAFRLLGGEMFPANMPAWYIANFPLQPFEVESVGSMVLMDAGPVYDGVRYTTEWAIRGICLQYRERGLKIYADPTTNIFHPFVDLDNLYFGHHLTETKVNERR